MLQILESFWPPNCSWHHSLNEIILSIAWWIYCPCPPEMAKRCLSEHWPLNDELTLFLGAILDVVIHGAHGGNLCLLGQGWHVWSTWTEQNVDFDCHFIANSNANCTEWLQDQSLFHVWSPGCFDTDITRHPFCPSKSFLYLSNLTFLQPCTTLDQCKHSNNIGPTHCKGWECWKLLQLAAICYRITIE
jgi:hypothetical protein